MTGAKCAIARDEQGENTIYEAKLPLSAIPGLNPRALAQKDGVVRFGFIVHNAEGTPLDWGAANGNFPWWENTSTFLPEGRLTSALRSTLGFSLVGDVASPVAPSAPVIVPTNPPLRVAPTPRPIPNSNSGLGTLPPPSPIAPPILPAPPRPTPRPSIPPFTVPGLPPPSGPLSAPNTPAQTTTSTPLPPSAPTQVVPYVVPPSNFSPPRAGVY